MDPVAGAWRVRKLGHLLACSDEGDAVHGRHDGLLHQLPVDERQDEGRVLVARLRVGAHLLTHQVRDTGVHILRVGMYRVRIEAQQLLCEQGLIAGTACKGYSITYLDTECSSERTRSTSGNKPSVYHACVLPGG